MVTDEPIKPQDLSLGNFISCYGHTELVMGIVPRDNNTWWYVCHSATNQEGELPEDLLSKPYPIELTEEWRVALRIEKYKLPDAIKYVHEAQNYLRWFAGVNL